MEANKDFYQVRLMTHEDIDKCLILWKSHDFFEDKQTVVCAMKLNSEGFFVAEHKETGDLIGTCSVTKITETTSMVGYYTVDSRFHGQGIGRKTWDKALASAKENSTNLFLNGVPNMWLKYQNVEGFDKLEEAKILVFEIPRKDVDLKRFKDLDSLEKCTLKVIGEDSNEVLLEKMFAYDESVVGFSRRACWRVYLSGEGKPLTLVLLKEEDVVGFGCGRRDIDGNLIIGPLYADSAELFGVLTRQLIESVELEPEQKIKLSTLSTNKVLTEMLTGWHSPLWGARQYTKFVLEPAAAAKIYCVQSPGFFLY